MTRSKNDGKATAIYLKLFDGNNYSNWEFGVKLLLEQQGVLSVVGEEFPVESANNYGIFLKNDVKARTVIIQCVNDNILEML